MPITVGTATTAQLNSAGTSLAVNVPSVCDAMVTVLSLNAAVTVTPPSGWTQASGFPKTAGSCTLDAYYRVYASEPASYTWTFGSAKAIIDCYPVTGCDTSTVIDASNAVAETASQTTHTTPSVTSVTANAVGIAVFADRDGTTGSTWSTPTGCSVLNAAVETGSSEGSLATFSTGAVAAGTYSYSSTASNALSAACMGLIFLRPASAGSTALVATVSEASSTIAGIGAALPAGVTETSTTTAALGAGLSAAPSQTTTLSAGIGMTAAMAAAPVQTSAAGAGIAAGLGSAPAQTSSVAAAVGCSVPLSAGLSQTSATALDVQAAVSAALGSTSTAGAQLQASAALTAAMTADGSLLASVTAPGGTTTRPNTGATGRPNTGITARPNTGTTTRP